MSDKKDTGVVRTPEFRGSFLNLFRPRKANDEDPNSKEMYGAAMLFPPDADLSALKEAAAKCARDKWGADLPKKLKTPFLDAGDYDYEGYEKGWTLIRATTKQAPGVVGTKKDPLTGKLETLDESDCYPGAWYHATVRPFAYDRNGNKGVSFGLQNVQKLRDGEQIAGRRKPEDEFEAIDFGGDEGGETEAAPAESAESIFG